MLAVLFFDFYYEICLQVSADTCGYLKLLVGCGQPVIYIQVSDMLGQITHGNL